jgi:hypothetical protein
MIRDIPDPKPGDRLVVFAACALAVLGLAVFGLIVLGVI